MTETEGGWSTYMTNAKLLKNKMFDLKIPPNSKMIIKIGNKTTVV